jgi:hypothetical protein
VIPAVARVKDAHIPAQRVSQRNSRELQAKTLAGTSLGGV